MSDEVAAEAPSNVTQFPSQESTPPNVDQSAQFGAPTPEQPQGGAPTPEQVQALYADHLKHANTHNLFAEIKAEFQNRGQFLIAAHQALEHVLLRDQGHHADAVSAWDRVRNALKEVGAKFEEEEAVISGWLKKSDPRPPIQVAPPVPQPVAPEAPLTSAEGSVDPTTAPVPPEIPVSEQQPPSTERPAGSEPISASESPVVPDQASS